MNRYIDYIVIFVLLVTGIVSFSILNSKEEEQVIKKPINVYVFHQEECSYCMKLLDYLNEAKELDVNNTFNIVSYEITKDNNYEKLKKLANYFKFSIKGVPFFVIGDDYYSGYNEKDNEKILTKIKNTYDDPNYMDLIDNVVYGISDVKEKKRDNSKYITVVSMVIFVLFMLIFIVIISDPNIIMKRTK